MWERLRQTYGEVAKFVSVLPDGVEVPWDTLTVGEVLAYARHSSYTPADELQDGVFKKQVRDPYLVSRMSSLKSGTVTTVANHVVTHSWPNSFEELKLVINHFRKQCYESIIDDMVIWIVRAFPAYTPDRVLDKNLEDFLRTFVMAEKRLLQDGVLKEPINFSPADEPKKPQKKRVEKAKIGETVEEMKARFEREHSQEQPVPPVSPPKASPQLPPDLPILPAPEYDGGTVVVTGKDMIPQECSSGSPAERANAEQEMLRSTANIYPEYLDMMKEHGKLTPEMIRQNIEERTQKVPERLAQSEQEYKKVMARLRKKVLEEEAEAERKFKKGLGRRGRKPRGA